MAPDVRNLAQEDLLGKPPPVNLPLQGTRDVSSAIPASAVARSVRAHIQKQPILISVSPRFLPRPRPRLRLPADERTQTRVDLLDVRPRHLRNDEARIRVRGREHGRDVRLLPAVPRLAAVPMLACSCFRRRQWDCPRTSDSENLDPLQRLWNPMGVMTRQLRLVLYTVILLNFWSSVMTILDKWRQP